MTNLKRNFPKKKLTTKEREYSEAIAYRKRLQEEAEAKKQLQEPFWIDDDIQLWHEGE